MATQIQTNIEHNSQLLFTASINGNVNDVKRLIPVSDPKADDSWALATAAEYGHEEIVELLIPVSDPKAQGSEALQLAAKNGHISIVAKLIPVSAPKDQDSRALRSAAYYGHTDIVKLLLPVSDYYGVLEDLSQNECASERLKKCIEDYEVFSVKKRLEEAVQEAVQENDLTLSLFKRKM